MTDHTRPVERTTVLLVEDDEGIALPLRCSLEREGHRVEQVTSGREALARLQSGGISLVVLDVELPDLDGGGLAVQVRREQLAPAMLLLTAGVRGQRVARAHEETVVGYLSKPFAVREFLARTRLLLRRTEAPHMSPCGPDAPTRGWGGAHPRMLVGQVPQNVV